VKFGIFYVLECPDHDFARAYREMLEQISYAERLGFDEVWLAEHHGTDYGSMPSPQVAAAAIAERTERMRIGIAVSNLTFDWPVRIAEDYAMVDVLSGGRLDFGVGRGYQPQEFHNMGVGDIQGESREVFVEALEIVRGLWSKPVGEPFSFHGKHFDLDNVDCRPTPVQRPTPPIYIASISPETLDLAADQGYNMLVTPTLMTMPELNAFVVDAKRRLRDHGRDILDLDFPMNWQIHLADTEETAVENARDALTWYFDAALAAVPQGPEVPPTYERYAELVTATDEAGGMTVEGLRDGGVVYVGDPDGLIRQIDALHDETGLQHLICWMRFGGLEHEKVMRSLELFAEHIIPRFRDREPVVPRALRDHPVPHISSHLLNPTSLLAQEDTMGFLPVENDRSIYFEHHRGEGRPIVLVHGWGATARAWDTTLPALLANGNEVVTVDLRCCGRSDKDFDDVTIAALASDIVRLVDHLGLDRPVVNGWSLGGAVATAAVAQLGDRASALVLTGGASPRYTATDDWPHGGAVADVEAVLASAAANRAETFRGVAAAVCAENPGEAVLDSIWDMFMAMGPRGDDSLRDLATVDLRKEIASLEVPILLLHGRADAFVPFSAAEAVPTLNHRAEVVEFTSSGHAPFLEERDRYLAELTGFLNR
jgi:alkanesulfonate monooxygenase SsuD/methylene tetrahydromethanopterin reductase-like flavin-dependent oxidoreductase (luciferase family)/pimeloyl-ACP methyl ester carboxylesterase